MAKEINAKLLEGLTFMTTEVKKAQGKDKKAKDVRVPVERSLTPDDVLDWKDNGEAGVVIVAKDGRKHVVTRKKAA